MSEFRVPWRFIGRVGGDRLRIRAGDASLVDLDLDRIDGARGGAALSDMSAEATALELDDKFHDECGLFGVWNHAEAANVVYLGLYALQHRGQESAGIASTDGDHFQVEKAMGWVADVFSRDRLKRLPGHRAIGHVRYSTAGSSNLRNAQPITGTTVHGPVAIAHNGNLVNAEALREELEKDGAVFQSSSDTEVILHLLARSEGATLAEQLARALTRVRGAYTLLLLTPSFGDRGARSLRLPAPDPGPPGRRVGAGLGDLRARPAWRPRWCATSSRARSW